jgi:hypothetical protein
MKNQNMNVMMIEINLVCPFCTVIKKAVSGSIFTLVIGGFDFMIYLAHPVALTLFTKTIIFLLK